jgi:hypothetical protein
MATVHGKATILTVATNDISPYCKTSSFERTAKTHDVTGYGEDDEVHAGGLRTGKFTVSGVYDNTATVGPRNALNALLGTVVAVVRKVEGTGSGKPQDAFDGVLEKYVETNPHDDMITWSADFQLASAVTITAQGA